MKKHKITRLTIHNTDTLLKDNKNAVKKLLSIQQWHRKLAKKTFPDIAYHYAIDREGKVYEGRNIKYMGVLLQTMTLQGIF